MGNSHSTAHSPHAHGRERGGRNSAANVAAADAGSADAGRTSAAEEGPPAAAEPVGSPAEGSESAARQRASGAAEGQRRGLSALTAGLLSSAREHRGASRGRGWRTHGGTLALGAAQANGADAQVRAPLATRQPSAGTAGRGSAGRRGAAGAGAGAGGTGRSTTAAAAAAAAAAVAAVTAVDGEAEAGAAGSGNGAAAAAGRAAATGGAAGEAGGGGGGGGGRGGEATERGTGGGEGEGEQAAIQEQRTQTVRSLVNLRKHSVHLLPVPRRLQSAVPGDQGGPGVQGERGGGGDAAGGKEAVSEEAETEAAVEEGRDECERTQQHDGQQQQESLGGNEGEASGESARGVEEGVSGSVVKIPPLSYPADACLPASAAHLPPPSASAAASGAAAASAAGAAQEAGEGDAAAAGGQGVEHPYVYGLSFIADCSVPCNVTVHVMAYEKDRHRKDKPPRLKSKVTQREASAAGVVAGLEQTFSLPPSCLLAFDGFQDAQLTSTKTSPSHTYPIVIRIQTALPAGRSHDPAARAQQQTHTTYATLVKQADSTYGVQVLKQVLWVGGCSYVLHEIFGIDGPASSPAPLHAAPGDTADPNGGGANVECVVCLEDPRDTLVLPCRHLCLCLHCAKALRFQSNKCPICRSVVQSLLQIKLSAPRVGQGEEERKGKRVEQAQVMEGRKVHGEREVQVGGEEDGQGVEESEGVRETERSCTAGTEESIMCGGGSGVAEGGAERMRADGQEGKASREEGGEAGADYRVVGAEQRVSMSGSGKGVERGVDRREMTCEEESQGAGGKEARGKEEVMVQVESGPGSGESYAGQQQGVGVAHEARVEVGC
ncbi:unnamed protein product [Closterium sp. NIES-65]|nr:unnamed protein product [Closterium sp. NIES-65]